MTKLRVMTWNVWGQPGDFDERLRPEHERGKPEADWKKRGDLIARIIRRYAPDLIGLQEPQRRHFECLRGELGEYGSEIGLEYDEGINAQYLSLFWKRERLELLDVTDAFFSRTPDVDYPMGGTWARLRDVQSAAELVHVNTHLEDGRHAEASRVDGAKAIADRAGLIRPALPMLVTGDFNCNPGSGAYEVMRQAGFRDAWRAAGNVDGSVSTLHCFEGEAYDARDPRFGGPDADPFWRVDWILVRDGSTRFLVESCAVIRDWEPPLYPSDHYPVLADFALVDD